jgi:hypothetical protein
MAFGSMWRRPVATGIISVSVYVCLIACLLDCLLAYMFASLFSCFICVLGFWPHAMAPAIASDQTKNKRHCKCEISGLVLVWFLARLFACLFICVFVVGFFRLLVYLGPRDGCSHCIGPKKKTSDIANDRYQEFASLCLFVCLCVS